MKRTKGNKIPKSVTFAENLTTPEHSCPALKPQCNKCKRTGHFDKVYRSRTVNRIQEEQETGSNTNPLPEVDHIQSANSANRIDIYKAVLLVDGQPIGFVIDIGSPVTSIPPIINPKKTQNAS